MHRMARCLPSLSTKRALSRVAGHIGYRRLDADCGSLPSAVCSHFGPSDASQDALPFPVIGTSFAALKSFEDALDAGVCASVGLRRADLSAAL